MMTYGYLRRVTAAIVTLFAATIALAACSINADNPPTIGGSSARDGYYIEIEFTSALNLPARAKVLSRGIDVGAVTSVTYDGGHALVAARIDKDAQLPEDSRAELRQDTLLGEIYVAILPPRTAVHPSLAARGIGNTSLTHRTGCQRRGRDAGVWLMYWAGVNSIKSIPRYRH